MALSESLRKQISELVEGDQVVLKGTCRMPVRASFERGAKKRLSSG